jgi:hypothetical protein
MRGGASNSGHGTRPFDNAARIIERMDWSQLGWVVGVGALATLILTTLGILDKLGKWLASAWRWSRRLGTHHDAAIPKTIVAIPQSRLNALWWGCTKQADGRLVTQICCDLNVTNTCTEEIKLAGAIFRRRRGWFTIGHDVSCEPMVKSSRSQYHGRYELIPNRMTDVRLGFMFSVQRAPKPERDLIADVALIDQFGNHHWLKHLPFKHVEHIRL